MKLHRIVSMLSLAAALMHAPAALADVVLDWNDIGLARTLAARQSPPDAARSLAMMHVAMFDAIDAVDRKYKPYAHEQRAAQVASAEAAGVAAAATVLGKLFPEQAQAIEAAYATSVASFPEGAAKAAGIALGREVGAQCLEMRANDGVGGPATYKPKIEPGVYSPTAYPVSSEWVKVKPWVMIESSQFRPPPPPDLAGAVWKRDIDEIRTIGARNSATRSAEQTDVARFWTAVGPATWNPVVRSLALCRNASLVDNARLFALVNMAASDAFVAVFDAKYAYLFWRPITAIRYGGVDGWTPLVDTPMHPEYPCAHCISAAAVATVLEAEFGDGAVRPITMTSPTAPGVTRTWTRIADYVQEVDNARVWGGIHYRNSTVVGEQMGRGIGRLAVTRFMTPLGG